eukprot:1322536-Karenia_brevis.AAC.1
MDGSALDDAPTSVACVPGRCVDGVASWLASGRIAVAAGPDSAGEAACRCSSIVLGLNLTDEAE